jgi:hypothetical protein
MKKINFIYLLFSVLFFSSCKKDEQEKFLLRAGNIINSNVYYFDFIPDLVVRSFGNMNLDLNNDKSPDMNLWVFLVEEPERWGIDYASYLTLLDTTFQIIVTADSVSPRILNYNDTIDNKYLWSNKPKKPLDHFKLSRTYGNHVTHEGENYTYWLGKTGYIGVRKMFSSGYKYGWIHLSNDSYISVTIFDYCFMK